MELFDRVMKMKAEQIVRELVGWIGNKCDAVDSLVVGSTVRSICSCYRSSKFVWLNNCYCMILDVFYVAVGYLVVKNNSLYLILVNERNIILNFFLVYQFPVWSLYTTSL